MEGNNNNMCDVCGSGNGRCGKCGHNCGFGRGHILRWILGIIIITWVFCIGMKMGEIKAYLEASGYGYSNHYKYRVMPMMGGASFSGADQVYFSQAVPTTGAVPTMMSAGTVKVIKQ